jgi:hypothetical protein
MTRRVALRIIFCLFLVSCSMPQGNGPQAWIDAPLDGASLPLAQTEIVFHSYAAGNPKAVELTINGSPIPLNAPDLSQPLSTIHALWNPPQTGRYIIVARGQDQKGKWSEPHTHIVMIGEATITPTASPTPLFTPTSSPTPRKGTGTIFSNLRLSTTTFYRLDQMPTKVTFTINVNDPVGIKLVEIYFRLRNPITNETTEWTNEDMAAQGGGDYSYTLTRAHPALASSSPKTMTVQYQFIVTHPDVSLVRSPVYGDVTLKGH